jgi:hypothetical protein
MGPRAPAVGLERVDRVQPELGRAVGVRLTLGSSTVNRLPSGACDLGPKSRAIIESIAERHPEANPDLIADAPATRSIASSTGGGHGSTIKRRSDR